MMAKLNAKPELQKLLAKAARGEVHVCVVLGNGASRLPILPKRALERVFGWACSRTRSLSSRASSRYGDAYEKTRPYIKNYDDFRVRFQNGVDKQYTTEIDEATRCLPTDDKDWFCWNIYEASRLDCVRLSIDSLDWVYKVFLRYLLRKGGLEFIVTTNYDTFLNQLFEDERNVVINPCTPAQRSGTCDVRNRRTFRNATRRHRDLTIYKVHGCLSYSALINNSRLARGTKIASLGLDPTPALYIPGRRHFIDYNGIVRRPNFEFEIEGARAAIASVPSDGRSVVLFVLGFGAYHQPYHEDSEEIHIPIIEVAHRNDRQFPVVLIDEAPKDSNALWAELYDFGEERGKYKCVFPFIGSIEGVLKDIMEKLPGYHAMGW